MDVAKTDFKGLDNTQKMITTDTSCAGYQCSTYPFGNGQKGYLPAAGEWLEAYLYKTKVDAALSLIGGSAIGSGYYWTSTQYNDTIAWKMGWSTGTISGHNKGQSIYARPFTTLNL